TYDVLPTLMCNLKNIDMNSDVTFLGEKHLHESDSYLIFRQFLPLNQLLHFCKINFVTFDKSYLFYFHLLYTNLKLPTISDQFDCHVNNGIIVSLMDHAFSQ